MKSVMEAIILAVILCLAGVRSDNCTLRTTEMNIIRRITGNVDGQERPLTCVGKVNLNECEGSCTSFVKPSANNYPSFDKDCKCCRESGMSTKSVSLTTCYDGEYEVPSSTFSTTYVEPTGCACYHCRN